MLPRLHVHLVGLEAVSAPGGPRMTVGVSRTHSCRRVNVSRGPEGFVRTQLSPHIQPCVVWPLSNPPPAPNAHQRCGGRTPTIPTSSRRPLPRFLRTSRRDVFTSKWSKGRACHGQAVSPQNPYAEALAELLVQVKGSPGSAEERTQHRCREDTGPGGGALRVGGVSGGGTYRQGISARGQGTSCPRTRGEGGKDPVSEVWVMGKGRPSRSPAVRRDRLKLCGGGRWGWAGSRGRRREVKGAPGTRGRRASSWRKRETKLRQSSPASSNGDKNWHHFVVFPQPRSTAWLSERRTLTRGHSVPRRGLTKQNAAVELRTFAKGDSKAQPRRAEGQGRAWLRVGCVQEAAGISGHRGPRGPGSRVWAGAISTVSRGGGSLGRRKGSPQR